MSGNMERIKRLPRAIHNPFAQPSNEEKAVHVIASFSNLPQFQGRENEVADIITMIKKQPTVDDTTPNLGHRVDFLNQTEILLRQRVRNGVISEEQAKEYLEAINSQREISSLRPPTLLNQLVSSFGTLYKDTIGNQNILIASASNSVAGNLIGDLIVPFSSLDNFLIRQAFTFATIYTAYKISRTFKR